METTRTGRTVFTATYDWYEIIEREGELELSEPWEGSWELAADIAEIDPDLNEAWVVRVRAVGDRHTAIKPGDYVCCEGYGSDVIFVRIDH